MTDTRYTVQWSRPQATDRTRLTRWLDLQTFHTRVEAETARDEEAAGFTSRNQGGDGLTEYRVVQRVDTPVEELDLAFDLHTADAIEVLGEFARTRFCARCQDEALAGLRDQNDTRCGHDR